MSGLLPRLGEGSKERDDIFVLPFMKSFNFSPENFRRPALFDLDFLYRNRLTLYISVARTGSFNVSHLLPAIQPNDPLT